jgi:hypothetical protein
VLPVSVKLTPKEDRDRAYALHNSGGGYKVPSLIGLAVTAPYLHDGGVAASATALTQTDDGFYKVTDPDQIGLAGTTLKHIAPDPEASLRVLLDRPLRQVAVKTNRTHPDLQTTNVEGIGHEYWVDQAAGYSAADQTALIQFLLSLDDDPVVLPTQLDQT